MKNRPPFTVPHGSVALSEKYTLFLVFLYVHEYTSVLSAPPPPGGSVKVPQVKCIYLSKFVTVCLPDMYSRLHEDMSVS